MTALLHRVAETHRGPAERKGIRVEVDLQDQPMAARLDGAGIEQVVDDLVANAVKFTPRDQGAAVTLRGHLRGEQVVIEVGDEGVGIEEADLERLFEPFARARRSGTDGEPSSGLGLAITRSLVQAHDGTVTVTSEPGRGTTFSVWCRSVGRRAPEAGSNHADCRGPRPTARPAGGDGRTSTA